MRVAATVSLTDEQRQTLEEWARGRSLPARQVERAKIVLLAAAGRQDLEIAAELRISNQKAARWRKRFMTHDYKRNGTATLFAALNALNGKVISLCQERHRHQEWIKFLRLLNDATPSGKQLHLIADNYATHKHPKVQRWLSRHRRFHVHFTPTGSSWLNMVERFFRDLTHNRLKRGVFRDVEELINAIDEYVDRHNEKPKPFIWTASANDILEKVKRARKTLDNVQSV